MKKKFSVQWKAVALLTAALFLWDQITWADSVQSYKNYPIAPTQPASDAGGETPAPISSPAVTSTTIDFLLGANSPLSQPSETTFLNEFNKTYDQTGRLKTEITSSSNNIRHVYSGESIQEVIEQSLEGDTVFIHSGTYHAHLVLKSGVNLKGEDQEKTVIHGDYQSQQHVIRALGDNRVENLTVSGSGPYAGVPSSAIRIEGDHVKVRHNRIVDNRDYGIFVWSGVDALIEMNLIRDNNLGVQLPKDTTLIRYNTFIHNNIGSTL